MEGNPGRTKATEAAQSVGARLALPVGPDGVTDFNDMAQQYGREAAQGPLVVRSMDGEQPRAGGEGQAGPTTWERNIPGQRA